MSKSGFATEHLRSFVERLERLQEEKDALAADMKEVYAEAKGMGFDTKTLRKVMALRKLDTAELQEQAAMLDLYCSSLGMLSDLPLGQAAIEKVAPRAVKARAEAAKAKEPLPPHDAETGEVIEDAPAPVRVSAPDGETVLHASPPDEPFEIPSFLRRERETEPILA